MTVHIEFEDPHADQFVNLLYRMGRLNYVVQLRKYEYRIDDDEQIYEELTRARDVYLEDYDETTYELIARAYSDEHDAPRAPTERIDLDDWHVIHIY